jgi:hypothetical protein
MPAYLYRTQRFARGFSASLRSRGHLLPRRSAWASDVCDGDTLIAAGDIHGIASVFYL